MRTIFHYDCFYPDSFQCFLPFAFPLVSLGSLSLDEDLFPFFGRFSYTILCDKYELQANSKERNLHCRQSSLPTSLQESSKEKRECT